MKRKRHFGNESLSSLSDEELTKRLIKTLVTTAGLIVLILVSLVFFAPKIGSFFGLLSVHRNDKDETPRIKPNPPIFSGLPEFTNQEKFSLTGFTQPGYSVTLFVNGPEKAKAIAGSDGVFNFSDIKLNTGRNSLCARAIDTQGTESDNTSFYTIILDNKSPKLDIESPKNGDTVKNLDKRIIVKGKVDEDADVTINQNMVVLDENKQFEYLLGAKEGNMEIKISAVDKAGNKSEEILKIKYVQSSF